MTEPLDLAPLDRGLDRLVRATSGAEVTPALMREGEELAEAWRSEIRAEGLISTGAYIGSLRVRSERGQSDASVSVGTDLGYPNVLEHGSRFMRPHPVAARAFLREEDRLIEEVGEQIAREIEG